MQDDADFCCPLCGGEEVHDVGNRPRESCSKCNGKARTRAAYLALRSAGAFDSGAARILLLSPDRILARETAARTTALDIRSHDPERQRFSFAEIRPFDFDAIEAGERFDIVMHNHLLDAIPHDFADAVTALDALVAPGGWHLFSVPVRGTVLDELEPGSSAEQRAAHFGRPNRYRTFGADDLVPMLGELWGVADPLFPLRRRYSRKDLHRHGLALRHFERPHSNTIFGRRMPG